MMGGFGSGKWADVMTRKVNTSLCRTLSVKRLKTMGVFDAENEQSQFFIKWFNELGEDAGKVTITRQAGGNGNKRSLRVEIGDSADASRGFVTVTRPDAEAFATVTGQVIPITTTPCFYGGQRYWFLCPAMVDGMLCENRVGVLYLPPAGKIFACRHCYGLTYESCQQSHKYDRVMEHIDGLDEENLTINQVLRLSGL